MKTRRLLSSIASVSLVLGSFVLIHPVNAEDCFLDTDDNGTGDSTAGALSNGNDERLACGRNATATGAHSVAVGYDATATGFYSIAVGYAANSPSNYSIGFGHEASPMGVQSTALGSFSIANSFGSIAAGIASEVTSTDAEGAIAIGDYSKVKGTAPGAIAIGGDTDVDANTTGTRATATNAIALGADSIASVANTVILGSPSATTKVGINTSTPSNELDIRSGSPAIRLDDTSTDAGRVDLDINDNEFAIEGNSNQDIVEIDTRAPEHALSIRKQGDVGIGTRGALADLHVVGDGVLDADGNAEQVLRLESSVPPEMAWLNSTSGQEWAFRMTAGNNFNMNLDGKRKFTFFKDGNLYIVGALTQNSDRDSKTAIAPVDNQKVLDAVVDLPISTWEYKSGEGVKHLGPMAQDFHAAFGLGNDPKGIASIDTGGVALAAIKGLNEVGQSRDTEIQSLREEKNREIESLREENLDLAARLEMLENLVNKLVAKEVVMNH